MSPPRPGEGLDSAAYVDAILVLCELFNRFYSLKPKLDVKSEVRNGKLGRWCICGYFQRTRQTDRRQVEIGAS